MGIWSCRVKIRAQAMARYYTVSSCLYSEHPSRGASLPVANSLGAYAHLLGEGARTPSRLDSVL